MARRGESDEEYARRLQNEEISQGGSSVLGSLSRNRREVCLSTPGYRLNSPITGAVLPYSYPREPDGPFPGHRRAGRGVCPSASVSVKLSVSEPKRGLSLDPWLPAELTYRRCSPPILIPERTRRSSTSASMSSMHLEQLPSLSSLSTYRRY